MDVFVRGVAHNEVTSSEEFVKPGGLGEKGDDGGRSQCSGLPVQYGRDGLHPNPCARKRGLRGSRPLQKGRGEVFYHWETLISQQTQDVESM